MPLQRSNLLFESFFQNVESRRLEKVVAMPIDADGELVWCWPKQILRTQPRSSQPRDLKFAKVNLEKQDGMQQERHLMLSHREAIPPENFYLAVDGRVGSSERWYRKAACCYFRSPEDLSYRTRTAWDMHFGVMKRCL